MTTTTAPEPLSVVFGGIHGGIAHSTNAWMTVLELGLRGHRVLGVDAARGQHLFTAYSEALNRGDTLPFRLISWPTADGMVRGVRRHIDDFGASALVIDAGRDGAAFYPAAGLCEQLVIGCAPTTRDLAALIPTFTAARRAAAVKAQTGAGPLRVSVLLVCPERSAAHAGVARTFLAGQDVGLLDTQIPRKSMYRNALTTTPRSAGAYNAVVSELLAARAPARVAA